MDSIILRECFWCLLAAGALGAIVVLRLLAGRFRGTPTVIRDVITYRPKWVVSYFATIVAFIADGAIRDYGQSHGWTMLAGHSFWSRIATLIPMIIISNWLLSVRPIRLTSTGVEQFGYFRVREKIPYEKISTVEIDARGNRTRVVGMDGTTIVHTVNHVDAVGFRERLNSKASARIAPTGGDPVGVAAGCN